MSWALSTVEPEYLDARFVAYPQGFYIVQDDGVKSGFVGAIVKEQRVIWTGMGACQRLSRETVVKFRGWPQEAYQEAINYIAKHNLPFIGNQETNRPPVF